MVIKINIPDELAVQAQERGLSVEAYAEQILAEQIGTAPTATPKPRTSEEIRAWLDSLAQFFDKIPPLPDVVSREWIYQDHD